MRDRHRDHRRDRHDRHHWHEHRHHWQDWPGRDDHWLDRDGRPRLRHYFGAHLHRRLFVWFGASIIVASVVSMFVSRHYAGHHPRALWVVGIPVLVLWAASRRVARRLARPLYDLVEVTDQIGAGNLAARTSLDCGPVDEIGVLGRAINQMAARIERQMADQKQLLAEVSHELRTPLARIRLLVELARSGKLDAATLDEIEGEAVEIDRLVGELLASARLDFSAQNCRPLDGADLARRAAERASLPAEAVSIETTDARLEGDATLLGRALANLVDNARKHGAGVERVRVGSRADSVMFVVEDRGPGFTAAEAARLTEALARGERPHRNGQPRPEGSLGLGLALVQRIARSHGGKLTLESRPEGGARVTLEVARRPAAAAEARRPPAG
jgi:two-component system OmpR family sensor kinase